MVISQLQKGLACCEVTLECTGCQYKTSEPRRHTVEMKLPPQKWI